jgi:hypothetical protein
VGNDQVLTKQHFGFENYLSVIGNFEHRRCLTKLRISAHRLHIETGRYQGIPPHQRLCGQCDSGEVEDEIHFLLIASTKITGNEHSSACLVLTNNNIF